MSAPKSLPGLPTGQHDALQRAGDEMNRAVQMVFKLNFPLIAKEHGDKDDAGNIILGCLAGIISAAGVICSFYEPQLDGDVLAGIVKDQFNEGRADGFAMRSEGATQ